MSSLKKTFGERIYQTSAGELFGLALARFLDSMDDHDPIAQDIAIRYARYVGGGRAVEKLLKYVDKTEQRITNHVFAPPVALPAMESLAYVIKDPPIKPGVKVTLDDIPKWKRWAGLRKIG